MRFYKQFTTNLYNKTVIYGLEYECHVPTRPIYIIILRKKCNLFIVFYVQIALEKIFLKINILLQNCFLYTN